MLTLVEFLPRLPAGERARIGQRTIWPLRVVAGDNGAATGIVMRMIPSQYFARGRPREIGDLFHAPADARELGLPQAGTAGRITLCARISATYMLLHRAGIVVGDVSARNVVFTAGERPHILVVDTDSARKEGTRGAFGSQPHTPFWEPPEALAAERLLKHASRSGQASPARLRELADTWQRQTRQTDVYKFGLMVVRLLDFGRRRTQNRDPGHACQVLRDSGVPEAARVLSRSLAEDPKLRPAMSDWYRAFGNRPPRPRDGGRAASGPARQLTPTAAGAPAVRQVGGWRFVDGTGWVRD